VHFDGFFIVLRNGDSSRAYQIGFQDPATTIMEGIYLFNLHLLAVIISVVLLVAWLLCAVLRNFTELNASNAANFTHSNIIEIVWTSLPAFILLSLASPV
jgi:cytochrome c oxidase subunit II